MLAPSQPQDSDAATAIAARNTVAFPAGACVSRSSDPVSYASVCPSPGLRFRHHVLHREPQNVSPLYASLNCACVFVLKKELTHTILLHPSYFGPRMLQYLESKLYADVEGTCSGQFGYIIAVVTILNIGEGMVLPGSGQAEFITRYRAIVFKPFKGEVVDGVVNNVNKVRYCMSCAYMSTHTRLFRCSDGFLRGRWTSHCIRVAPSLYFNLRCLRHLLRLPYS